MVKATKQHREPTLSLPGFSLLKDNPLYSTAQSFLDTGNYLLNWSISNDAHGGWPMGKLVELFGDPSTGKSLLAAKAMASIQQRGGIAILDDVEHAFEPHFARSLGMDPDSMLIGSSLALEECFENISKAVCALEKAGAPNGAVFVVDSLGMLSSKHELEVGFDKRDMTKAQLIRQAVRMLLHDFSRTSFLLIVLNHTTTNIGNTFSPRTTPGGTGTRFGASVRIDLRYAGKLPGSPPRGVLTKFRVEKNRCAPPFRQGELRILFDSGVTPWSGVADALLAAEMLTKGKAGYATFSNGKSYRLSTFDSSFPKVAEDMGYDDPAECLNALLTEGYSGSAVHQDQVDELE